MDIIAQRPGPSVQTVFEGDTNPAPDLMRQESPAWKSPRQSRRWIGSGCWSCGSPAAFLPKPGGHAIVRIVNSLSEFTADGPWPP